MLWPGFGTRKVLTLHAQADLAQSKLKAVAKNCLFKISLYKTQQIQRCFQNLIPVNLHLATAEGSWHRYGPHNGVPYAPVANGVTA